MRLKIEFSGGLELLFDSQKEHGVEVPVPAGETYTVGQLLVWTRDTLCRERPELFMKGESVRPGILVLVNDCDWELRWAAPEAARAAARPGRCELPDCRPAWRAGSTPGTDQLLPAAAALLLISRSALRSGTLSTELQEGDHVVFISTLHGG
jgi:ubiquitin related modifier 1